VEAIILAGTDFALVFNPDNTDFLTLMARPNSRQAIMRCITV
jgi:hypothetical protein